MKLGNIKEANKDAKIYVGLRPSTIFCIALTHYA